MTDIERKKLDDLVARVFTLAYELGTNVDELFKEVRKMRFETKDRDFEAALINLEHAFFMVAQSINILKEQTRNVTIPAKKLA
ncbi:MAG: replication initiation protein [Sulfurihydrogenibium sp.]|nr:MAG: replication initiation protein [Sulfurihydrogenibium sp.]